MKYLDIIKAPVVTEKSALLNEKNEYAFFVDVKANSGIIIINVNTTIPIIIPIINLCLFSSSVI